MVMSIGLTGLKAANTHLQVVSQNVANVSTTGFKSGRAEFGDLVDSNAAGIHPGLGVRTQNIDQEFLQGNPEMTGNALDLAINGNGFFIVKDPSGTAYTRAGNFHPDKDGFIVNNLGQRVQDKTGAADLQLSGTGPWTDINVDKNGNITAFDSTGAATTPLQVGMANFPNVDGLKRVGDTQWAATPEAGAVINSTPGSGGMGLVSSGMLEASNVDITEQLVDMIVAQRDFQANAQTITAGNNMVQTIINIR
ncbi:MAG: flagellar hook basal-body protein [Candidatus Competibacteraceae bacterium]|nr:flagellar hook basal-body protein [Candidatus Competibacteraceae bacterium]